MMTKSVHTRNLNPAHRGGSNAPYPIEMNFIPDFCFFFITVINRVMVLILTPCFYRYVIWTHYFSVRDEEEWLHSNS